jgi:hypothetical protein
LAVLGAELRFATPPGKDISLIFFDIPKFRPTHSFRSHRKLRIAHGWSVLDQNLFTGHLFIGTWLYHSPKQTDPELWAPAKGLLALSWGSHWGRTLTQAGWPCSLRRRWYWVYSCCLLSPLPWKTTQVPSSVLSTGADLEGEAWVRGPGLAEPVLLWWLESDCNRHGVGSLCSQRDDLESNHPLL